MIEINKLVRSKRKTLALIVESDGRLTVRVPLRMKDDDIRQFVMEKEKWIKRKQAKVRKDSIRPRAYVDGETFPYLGKDYPLQIVSSQKPALVLNQSFKLSKGALENAESEFVEWYKKQARDVFPARVSCYAEKHGFEVKKIRISSAHTRWGSCSSRGTLSFTWKLVLAPLEVLDYVVVHELCHLHELNHSRMYWALVEDILPDYKAHRDWLKKHGGRLRLMW
jgi:predicted metal-dependent hydrolase